MNDIVAVQQIVLSAVGTILTGTLLWVGHSINRLNGTVERLLERTESHTELINQCNKDINAHWNKFSEYDSRISRLEGVHR